MNWQDRTRAVVLWGICVFMGVLVPQGWAQAQQDQIRSSPAKQSAQKVKSGESGQGLKWKDEEQKKSCEAKARQIKEHFIKAREFSIQGDSCSSQEQALSFTRKFEELKKECPEGFAEQAGLTPKVVRNVRTLHSLGKERCREPKASESPGQRPRP
ncbi:MAG: hypothetical protein WHX93_05130 [bacterium]